MKIKLQKILDDRNISIYSLSKEIGVAQNNLGKIIKGETTSIKYDILEKICNILNITPNDIFEIEKSKRIFSDYTLQLVDKMKNTNSFMPDLQIQDENGDIHLIEIKNVSSQNNKKPYRLSGLQVLKNAKKFEETNGYNPIPTDEEYYEMEQMQDKLDMEYDFERNLKELIDIIVSKADITKLPLKIKSEIEAYQQIDNLALSFKFILVYRSLYVIIVKQFYDKELIDFVSKLRRIYNNGGLLELDNNELMNLTNESHYLLTEFILKQKD